MEQTGPQMRFAICVKNDGYVDDLHLRTVYQVLPDESAARSHDLRVIDETGEDYVYPAAYFVPIDVPHDTEPMLQVPGQPSKTGSKSRRPHAPIRHKSKVLAD